MSTTRVILVCAALLHQVFGQVVVDSFDPTRPRPGATLPASIDPYGFSRPLPPNVDPFGFSYRPVVAGATLPAMYDPLGVSRPGGLSYAAEPYGYLGFNRPNALGVPAYPGYNAMDGWYNYRPHVSTAVGAPIIPENAAATLVTTNALNPLPVQPVVSAVPVAFPVPVNTVSVPTIPTVPTMPAVPAVPTVPVNTAPVPPAAPAPIPSFNGMNIPSGMGISGFNTGGIAGTAGNLPTFNGFGNTLPGVGVPVGQNTGSGSVSSLLPPLPTN